MNRNKKAKCNFLHFAFWVCKKLRVQLPMISYRRCFTHNILQVSIKKQEKRTGFPDGETIFFYEPTSYITRLQKKNQN
jgi:hypothetical protein